MKNKRWAAVVALAVLNLLVLTCIYSFSSAGEDRSSAQKIGRVISTYAEPESNPVFLVRAEDRCRFYAPSYCASAAAQRQSTTGLFSNPIKLDTSAETALYYASYLESRQRLIEATSNYVSFLDTKPNDQDYLEASISFEEEAGVLVGSIVSNLYELQAVALRDSDHRGNWAFLVGFVTNALMVLFVAILAGRRNYKQGS